MSAESSGEQLKLRYSKESKGIHCEAGNQILNFPSPWPRYIPPKALLNNLSVRDHSILEF
ncbi:predicted protein [Sclerotinia sclerotiorum 1980 UF-70]|uniref:Uncharacterized protein n=1 Tax=Sclerotinia sclerotiorum (strain ATCC 18683 / 1980 / Ss-1) TaxID=665079 RepID=A7E7D7_SCLS1|nr:predicted protein [Sclerotinia sclerotiorum 1980 UF-70]EDN96289.1 predicted protein [Sclerotinia sclerotiorum 1980 UF-70]